jgi:hypothetical protein
MATRAPGIYARDVRRVLALLALLLTPAVAGAQSVPPPSPSPSSGLPAHIALPWGNGTAIPTGQILRDVWISPQTVVVDTIYAVPAGPPAIAAAVTDSERSPDAAPAPESDRAPQYVVWRQSLVVPGYWVRQTTAGDYYPQRWMLEQTAPGAYRWRLLPAEVRAR